MDNGQQLQGHHGKQAAIHKLQLETEAIRQQAEEDIDNVVLGIKQVGIKTNHNTTIVVDGVKSQQQQQNDGGGAHDAETENAKEETATNEGTQEPSVESHVEDTATPDEDKEKDTHTAAAAAAAETSLAAAPSETTTTTTTTTLMAVPPAHVCDEWKKRGRDASVLMGMGMSHGGGSHYSSNGIHNTLLVSAAQDQQENEEWNSFLDNASLLDEIRKDVVRTHPDLKFFLEPSDNLGHRRYAAMERILFVWAKLNKGVSTSCLLYIYIIHYITVDLWCVA
jgi:hypothetical protein